MCLSMKCFLLPSSGRAADKQKRTAGQKGIHQGPTPPHAFSPTDRWCECLKKENRFPLCCHNSSSVMRAWPFGPHQKTILTLRTPTVTTPISSCPMSVSAAYQVTYPVNVYIPLWFGQMTLELLPSYKHYFSKLVCHCGTTVALELLAICAFTILWTTDNCYFPVFPIRATKETLGQG